ncbi:MAG: hypothetical protein A3F83_12585 [Candidatus Glassbacteria bacterium RIFCSPLOWO2_12_FULL_58_11]|uniref:Steroid 5-alpha reductase C-terminal domain-containing protein n=1 Tax=Candidatus Glassbacteria bacterium RIFCSPLOWO2_12_FULL_58_11 TaxID=1817867 RepID=A0A1F5YQL9_9BACT|nr:MAG: hypothetical protein A3F83_12585 [Candidatus Glassbacteria bacterium RIFCSPLOWO2_12_FULL_58_11]
MAGTFVYGAGLAVLGLLAGLIGRRLRSEYRSILRPSLQTVVLVWALYGVHFSLVVCATLESAWRFSLNQPFAVACGSILILAGLAIYLSAVAAFGSLKRMSGMDTSRLVRAGIYRWSRNPQVVGWTLTLLGLGLARRSGMVLLLAALFWLGFRLYLPLEEELLGRLFGEAYSTYRHNTHRYFEPPGD